MDWQEFHLGKVSAGLAICQNAGTVLGLDDKGAKIRYGSCYRQRFDLTC